MDAKTMTSQDVSFVIIRTRGDSLCSAAHIDRATRLPGTQPLMAGLLPAVAGAACASLDPAHFLLDSPPDCHGLTRRAEHLGPVDERIALGIHRVGGPHLGEVRVHDVGAVGRAGQPAGYRLFRAALAGGDIFTDALPVVAGALSAYARMAAALVGMAEVIARGHVTAVRQCGAGESYIPG